MLGVIYKNAIKEKLSVWPRRPFRVRNEKAGRGRVILHPAAEELSHCFPSRGGDCWSVYRGENGVLACFHLCFEESGRREQGGEWRVQRAREGTGRTSGSVFSRLFRDPLGIRWELHVFSQVDGGKGGSKAA